MENNKREGKTYINKDIIKIDGNSKLSKIICYAMILSWRKENLSYPDIENKYISDITYQQLEERIEIKVDEVMPSLLKEASFIKAHKKQITKQQFRYIYTFRQPKNFFEIDNNFFQDINKGNAKYKAFLLLLKSVCLNSTNYYLSNKPIKNKINITELANRLGMAKDTLRKYLNMAIDNKDIELINRGFLITNEYIKADSRKDSLYKFLFDAIYKHCIDKGAVPPKYEEKPLRYLSIYYFLTDEDYIRHKGIIKNADSLYLPSVLNKRLAKMPTEVNWQYILNALIEMKDVLKNKPKTKFEIEL